MLCLVPGRKELCQNNVVVGDERGKGVAFEVVHVRGSGGKSGSGDETESGFSKSKHVCERVDKRKEGWWMMVRTLRRS